MHKLTVYGLPLNPAGLLAELEGASFCVSYGTRRRLGKQLGDAIARVGAEGLLLVDNGAFSNFRAGGSSLDEDYLDGFIAWAADILDDCPQAIAVIPDVIGGSEAENARLISEWPLERARSMAVWHLDESLGALLHRCVDHEWIAFGSSGAFWQIGTPAWHARVAEAFAAIAAWELASNGAYVRPRVHMMRAQSLAHLYPFDSADSTNLAINHSRQARLGEAFAAFAGRIDRKIQASAGPASMHQVARPMLAGYRAEVADLLFFAALRGELAGDAAAVEPVQLELPLAA